MALYASHFNFSLGLAVSYALFGLVYLHIYPEVVLLALILTLIAGLLPDLDSVGSAPTKDMVGLLSIFPLLIIFSSFSEINQSNITRITLVGVVSYAVTRYLLILGLQSYTARRGMTHSMPMAVIAFQVVFLLFFDLYWIDRLYLASGVFLGYCCHLIMDGWSKVDSAGKDLAPEVREIPVMKIFSKNTNTSAITYGVVLFLGYFVYRELSPHLASLTRVVLVRSY